MLYTQLPRLFSLFNGILFFDFGGVLGSDVQYTYLHSLLSKEKKDEVAHWVKKIGWNKMKTDPAYTEVMFWQDVIKLGGLDGVTTVEKVSRVCEALQNLF